MLEYYRYFKEGDFVVPNIKSAIKRVKVLEKKNLRNKAVKSEVSTLVKKFNTAINSNDPATAEVLLPEVFSAIDSAVSKGVYHKNNGANKKSAYAKRLTDLKSGKLVIATVIDNKTRIAEKKAKEEKERLEARKAREELRVQKLAEKEKDAKGSKKTKKADSKDEKVEEKAAAPKKAKKTEKTEKTEKSE